MAIEAPPTTLQCGQFYFCDLAPVRPAPGSPPFRTDGKGRRWSPSSCRAPTTSPPTRSTRPPGEPVALANDQRIHIDVQGVKRKHRVKKIGFGFGRATVQTGS